MNIAGIGIVARHGRGIQGYEQALRQGWVAPSKEDAPSLPEKWLPAYRVEQGAITDKSVLKKMRRADRFSKMAVIAAWDALEDSGILLDKEKASLGIIMATAFGPHVTTFRFLDDIIEYGDASVSPTTFSHSVHNAAASYIALALDCRGPALTVTRFAFAFHEALMLAQAWLQEGRCESVLVGGVDECGTIMEYICQQKLQTTKEGKIQPFHFSDTPIAVPGEGSVFFLITRDANPGMYCKISNVSLNDDKTAGHPDLYLLDADGMAGDETPYRAIANSHVMVAGYSPVFGSMMNGSAFHCAAAALMLNNQIRYACPVQDNPKGVNLCSVTEQAEIGVIHCVRYDCYRQKAIIELTRS